MPMPALPSKRYGAPSHSKSGLEKGNICGRKGEKEGGRVEGREGGREERVKKIDRGRG